MATLNEIKQFLEAPGIAMVGVSRNSKKFGGAIFKELKSKGFVLYPVNPNADEIQGVKCYKSVSKLPDNVKHLFIVTPRKETLDIVKEAVKSGFSMIWIQQKSDTPEAVESIQEAKIQLIHKKCLMMFANPVKGVHGFHRFINKAFGAYPKMVAPTVN